MIALAAVPSTPSWSLSVGLTMVSCNIVAFLLWKLVVPLINAWLLSIGYENRTGFTVPTGVLGGTKLPLIGSVPELLAATSFGHLIGAGTILGLTRLGAL